MLFSARTAQSYAPNAFTLAVARARARARNGGQSVLDLTGGNPTTVGLRYESQAILRALSDPRALEYAPSPLGLGEAREAVALDWTSRGTPIDASNIALTASTSEAFAVLFKILCDPLDEILVPAPSYPLLAFLAAFEGIRVKAYPLVYAGRWNVDTQSLRAAVTPRTKAIVVVSPNNPTGSYLGADELEAMLDLGVPIVSDEVFATYPLTSNASVPEGRLASVAGARRGLVFALSGLSKLAALPQLKLGWIGVSGAPAFVADAMTRLELVLDTYLSVATPVQLALPALLAARSTTEQAVRERTRGNLAVIRDIIKRAPAATVLDVEGGWYATLRLPEVRTDEAWAVRFADEDDAILQPGYLFDMSHGAHLVVSLLTPEHVLAEGIFRVARRIASEGDA